MPRRSPLRALAALALAVSALVAPAGASADSGIRGFGKSSWLGAPHYDALGATLAGGTFLLAGGFGGDDGTAPPVASAERYDPATNTWTAAAPLHEARTWGAMVALPDGRALAIGGDDGTDEIGRASCRGRV